MVSYRTGPGKEDSRDQVRVTIIGGFRAAILLVHDVHDVERGPVERESCTRPGLTDHSKNGSVSAQGIRSKTTSKSLAALKPQIEESLAN
jgi:hypothetical protein